MVLSLTACGKNSVSIGIIGGEDGPTAIFVTDGTDMMQGTVTETDDGTMPVTPDEDIGAAEGGDSCPRVTINGITYFDSGHNPLKAGLPPVDFSVYEESEITVEGAVSVTATAYAVCGDAAYLLINGEWYEFVPIVCDGVPLAPEGFSKP